MGSTLGGVQEEVEEVEDTLTETFLAGDVNVHKGGEGFWDMVIVLKGKWKQDITEEDATMVSEEMDRWTWRESFLGGRTETETEIRFLLC